MSIVWLSAQDKNDMEKSKISLVLKAAQIIVQSRLGDKMEIKSKAHSSGGDCFNLAVADIPSINANASRAISEQTDCDTRSICVEILLRTEENQTMVLESWSVIVNSNQLTCPSTVTYANYNKMCILLKSLLSVTRVAPAYKLCRRQGSESYAVSYAIHTGPPQIDSLGPAPKHACIVCSPPAQVDLWWRTDMTLSHHPKPLLLKSEHFLSNLGVTQQNEETEARIFGSIKAGAFVDTLRLSITDRSLMIGDAPFASLLPPSPPPSPPLKSPTPPPQISMTMKPSDVPREENISVLKSLFDGKGFESERGELEALCLACSRPPPLEVFTSAPTLATEMDTLGSTLQALENNMSTYDELMDVLRITGTSI